jgi:nucleotide-binding universal stress UspA family protein
MKWIFGIDLDPQHDGPLRFSRWLTEQSSRAGTRSQAQIGVHVLPPLRWFEPALEEGEAKSIENRAREAARLRVEAVGANGLTEIDYRVADRVDEALRAMVGEHHADVLVVGRHARADERRVVRLGSVARRSMRGLEAAVAVVPPELESVGDGPVLLTTNMAPDSASPAAFASKLVAELGLSLHVVHVVADLTWALSYLPAASHEHVRQEAIQHHDRLLEAWAHKLGIEPEARHVLVGDPATKVQTLARELDPSLVICGARKLSALDRWLVSSISNDIAASVPCPVIVS